MGSVESDIEVMKNDIRHIKDGIDDLRETLKDQVKKCDERFCELYKKDHDTSLKVQELDGISKTHSRYFGYFVLVIIAVIGWFGDIFTWLRGG